jgi:hypothetical protein
MSYLFPVVISFSAFQIIGYRYVDRKQLVKGRLKVLLAIICLYILLALAIPMAPDGEYMTSEVILLVKAGVVLVGAIFSTLIHFLMKLIWHKK